jgi:RNA polymerase sigma factor (TIGR02999 family)
MSAERTENARPSYNRRSTIRGLKTRMRQTPQNVTQLLIDWSKGDKEALDNLVPLVYEELRRQAARYLRHERAGHTLQTTALIHEAYLRLVDQRNVHWQNRAHFFGIAAQMMRRILVDHARTKKRAKRGGSDIRVSFSEATLKAPDQDLDIVALDEALEHLAEIDEQQSKIVELRFFSGLTVEETAEVLGISPATVKRDWSMAKAWLHREISGAVEKNEQG